MSIREKETEIEEEFALFDDWTDRYEHLIEQGRSIGIMDSAFKTEEHLIKGCQSQVWLNARFEDGRMYYTADSDAQIPKGVISLLLRVLSGEKPDDIVQAELGFIDRIGLKEHLSPTRANGLVSMIQKIKLFALPYSQVSNGKNN